MKKKKDKGRPSGIDKTIGGIIEQQFVKLFNDEERIKKAARTDLYGHLVNVLSTTCYISSNERSIETMRMIEGYMSDKALKDIINHDYNQKYILGTHFRGNVAFEKYCKKGDIIAANISTGEEPKNKVMDNWIGNVACALTDDPVTSALSSNMMHLWESNDMLRSLTISSICSAHSRVWHIWRSKYELNPYECITFHDMNSLMLTYWAYTNLDMTRVDKILGNRLKTGDKNPNPNGKTFEEFVDSLFEKEGLKAFIKQYVMSGSMPSDNDYEEEALLTGRAELLNALDYVEYIEELAEENNNAKEMIKFGVGEIDKHLCNEPYYHFIEKYDLKKKCAIAYWMLQREYRDDQVEDLIRRIQWFLCVYLMNKDKSEDPEEAKQEELFANIIKACVSQQFTGATNDMIYMLALSVASNRMAEGAEAKRLKDRLEVQVRQLEEKNSNIRKKNKELSKELVDMKNKFNQLRSEKEKLERNSAIKITEEELDALRTNLNKAKEATTRETDKVAECNRTINKKQREIESLSDKLEDSREKNSELQGKLDKLQEFTAEMEQSRAFNSIPVSCFCQAISKFKIVIIGGDMMFDKINSYGLPNVRLYRADYRRICYEDVSDVDIVVKITGFASHASFENLNNIAKAHDIKVIAFNNKNVDMLIYTIFTEMYK